MRFEGKVVLVTGSAAGVGESIARRVVAEGGRVLIHDIQRDLAEAVAASLHDKAAVHIDDLADPNAASRIVNAALKSFGRLDALVNNAAWIPRGALPVAKAELFDRVMAINVRAPMLLIQAALEHLAKTRGCVLNIGSINCYCGEPNLLIYSMSKGSMATMTRSLGDSLHREHGVRVNQLNPDWIVTSREIKDLQAQGLPPDWHTKINKWYAPSGGLNTPEQFALSAVHWISDESRPVSGSVVDMGQYPYIGRNIVMDIF